MDNPEKFESFEQVLFFMLKNAIKQASYELMMETEPQELSEDELEEMYEKLLDPVDAPKQLPLERLLIETDSPFLAPEPMRGKKNEPSFVRYTLKKLSELKNVDIEDLDKITTNNFNRLFFNK